MAGLVATAVPARANTGLVVDNATDGPGDCTVAGSCTLTAAIDAAIGGTPGPITFSVAGPIQLSSALPPITGAVTISGPVTLQGNGSAGLFDVASGGSLTLTNVTLQGGAATSGGGIDVEAGGSAALTGVRITANHASGDGGGIFNAGTLTAAATTLDNNQATNGGGLANEGGTAQLTNSTISGNQASGQGGGIDDTTGGVSLLFATVAANQAATSAAGVTGAATTSITDSILDVNKLVTGPTNTNDDCTGVGNLHGTNVVGNVLGTATACTSTPPAIAAPPNLGPLADNGGPTPTQALGLASSAIAAVPAIACTATGVTVDQRGVTRAGRACDLGAYAYPFAQATGLSSPTATTTGAFSVPISKIPPVALLPNGSNTGGPGATSLGATSLGATTLSDISLGATSLGATSLGATSLGATSLGATSLGATSLGATSLAKSTLGQVLLSQVAVSYPHGCAATPSTCTGWAGILAGTPFANDPLQSLSLEQVLSDPTYGPPITTAFNTLDIAEVDFSRSSLGQLPVVALLLGSVTLDQLPLAPASTYPGANPLHQWCAVLSAAGLDCVTTFGVNPDNADPAALGHLTLLNVLLSGGSPDALPLDAIDLSGVNLTGTPLGPIPAQTVQFDQVPAASLGATSLGATSLGATSLGATTLAQLSLGATSLGATSLGATPLTAFSLGATSLGATTLGELSLGATSLGATSLGATSLGATTLGQLSLGATSLGATSLGATTLGDLSLGATSLGATSLGATTLGDLSLGATSLGATSLGATLLSDTSLGATSLGATFLGTINITDVTAGFLTNVPGGATTLADVPPTSFPPGATLNDLFTNLDAAGQSIFNAVTLAQLLAEVSGGSLTADDAITLSALLGADHNAQSPAFSTTLAQLLAILVSGSHSATVDDAVTLVQLQQMLNGTGTNPFAGTTLFQLESLLASGSTEFANTTLVQFLAALNNTTPVTLAAIIAALQNAGVSPGDLLAGLLGDRSALPYENLNLGAVPLQQDATPAVGGVPFTVNIQTDDAGPHTAPVTLEVTLPDGFVYAPSSTQVDGHAGPEPTGDPLTWTLTGLTGGAHTVTFTAYASVNEGITNPSTALAYVPTGTTVDPDSSPVNGPNVTVSDTNPSVDPTQPTLMSADTLYFGHLGPTHACAINGAEAQAPSCNFYAINIGSGQKMSLFLGNLPADYDLVLYDLATAPELRQPPVQSLPAVNDSQLSINALDSSLPAETLQDVPTVPGRRVYAVSANRGLTTEEIDTGLLPAGQYLIEVVNYNGDGSPTPYTLRARVSGVVATTCAPRTPANPTATAPAVAGEPTPGGIDTLFLVNGARLAQDFGDVSSVFSGLTNITTYLGTTTKTAGVIRLDDATAYPTLQSDYAAWDANPCSVDAANAVVHDIGAILDTYQAAGGLHHIVLVGADDVAPMARLRDATTTANEQDFAQSLTAGNEISSSAAAGYILSDDPYAAQVPLAVGDRDLFVPDLAEGRLVETPAEIAGALNQFVTNQGAIKSDTGLSTGYDFLAIGANAVDAKLSANGRTVTGLVSDTWSKSDLTGRLLTANAPDITSLNAHFDPSQALPAIGNATNTTNDLFTTADVVASGATTLSGRLLFSMGCHSGLDLPAAALGATSQIPTWASTMADQGAIWVANTGYGYGDTASLAFSARLMTLFAGNLDSGGTIGQALMTAKQAYVSDLGVVSPYDEKAVAEATYYGLPMYSLTPPSNPGTTTPAIPNPFPSPGAATLDGIVPVEGANVSLSLPIDPIVGDTLKSGNAGDLIEQTNASNGSHFYSVDGQVQVTPDRPGQPLVNIPLTPPTGSIAHGALITSLSSQDVAGFQPDYNQPTIDNQADEPSPDVGDAPFPAGLQTVDNYATTSTTQSNLVLVPAQFRPTPGLANPGQGDERLYTAMGARVYFGSPSNPSIPPSIRTTNATVNADNSVTFTVGADAVTAGNSITRVLVLFTSSTQPGTWQALDLTLTPNGLWQASAPIPNPGATNPGVDFYVQAVDQYGNVGLSANKGDFFEAINSGQTGTSVTFSEQTTAPPGAHGFFRGPVKVTIIPHLAGTITYSVDGRSATRYTGPFTVTGDAAHTVTAFVTRLGRISPSSIPINIDSLAPVSTWTTNPGPSVTGGTPWWGGGTPGPTSVAVTDTPTDPAPTGFASGVSSITYSAAGAGAISPPQTVNAAQVTLNLSADGTTTFSAQAQDRAGNTENPPATFTVNFDHTPPVMAPPSVVSANGTGPHGNQWFGIADGAVTANVSATDATSGVATLCWTFADKTSHLVLNGYPSCANGTPVLPGVPATATIPVPEGDNVLTISATDVAGNTTVTQTETKVDLTPPTATVSSSAPTGANGWNNSDVTVTFGGSDPNGADGSGVSTITYSASGAQNIAPTTALLPFSLVLSTEGVTTFSVFATDAAGNTSLTAQKTVFLDKSGAQPGVAFNHMANLAGWYDAALTPLVATITADDTASGIASECWGIVPHGTSPTGPPTCATGISHAPGALVSANPTMPEGVNDLVVTIVAVSGVTHTVAFPYKLDTHPPLVSAAAAATGPTFGPAPWYSRPVTVTFTATDPIGVNPSGPFSVSYWATPDATRGGLTAGSATTPIVLNPASASVVLSTQGVTTFHFFATDLAGNVSGPAQTFVVQLDTSAPVISLALPAMTVTATTGNPIAPVKQAVNFAGALPTPVPVYVLNQAETATWGCTDFLSGVSSATGGCQAVNGSQTKQGTVTGLNAAGALTLDTSTVGLHTITVSARDNVANVSTPVTFTYRVVYNLCESQSGTNLWIQLCDANKVVQQFAYKTPPTALLYSIDGAESKATKDPGLNYSFKCLVSPGGKACPTSGTGPVTLQYQQLPTGSHQIAFTVSSDPVTTPGTWAGPPAALPFDPLRLYVFSYKM